MFQLRIHLDIFVSTQLMSTFSTGKKLQACHKYAMHIDMYWWLEVTTG